MVEARFQANFFKSILLQDCLEDSEEPDSGLEPERGGRSQLLTDKDPLLGGLQGLSDTAGEKNTLISSTSLEHRYCVTMATS